MDGSYFVRDLIRQLNCVLKTHTIDVLVLISGSNDLTDTAKCPIQIAHDLFEIGQYAIHGFGVKSVIFAQAIRRSKCRGMSPDVFTSRVNKFNKQLTELCDDTQYCSRVIAMKGFWRNTDKSIKDVYDFAEDGIHPGSFSDKRGTDTDSASFKSLRKNVRRSFIAGIGHMKARKRYFKKQIMIFVLSYV